MLTVLSIIGLSLLLVVMVAAWIYHVHSEQGQGFFGFWISYEMLKAIGYVFMAIVALVSGEDVG